MVYFAEVNSHIVRRFSEADGTLTTIAGVPTKFGFNGDNIPATSAGLYNPLKVVVDSTSTYIFIADHANFRVRRVDLYTGIIETVAGTGCFSVTGDSSIATKAAFSKVVYIAMDSSGNLYVSDSTNFVRKLSLAATTSPRHSPRPLLFSSTPTTISS